MPADVRQYGTCRIFWRSLKLHFLLLLVTFTTAKAQYRFTHIDQRQGLSQNSVNCILEDSQGLMWFGTQDGLNLYDGYSFTVYRQVHNDNKSLRDNFILSLAEDTAGNIWIGTRNGLCVYDKKLQCFYSLIRTENRIIQFHAQVQKIVSTENGSVLFKDALDNLVNVRYENGHFINIATITTGVTGFDLHKNKLYVIRNKQLNIYDFPQYTIKKTIACDYKIRKNAASLFHSPVMWVVHEAGVAELNCETTERGSLAECINTTCLLADEENHSVWIGTENGLIVINGQSKTVLRSESNNNFTITDNYITCVYKSLDGLIWIGTATGGVNVFDPLQKFFAVYNNFSNTPAKSGPVWAIQSLAGGTILCSSSGMSFFPYENRPAWWKLVPDTAFITCTEFSNDGKFWLGSRTGGIYILDTLNGHLMHLTTSNSGLQSNQIRDLSFNASGMWVATLYGLHLMRSDNSWKCYNKSTHTDSLASGYIQHLYTDQLNQLWISTAEGVYKYDPGDDKFINYSKNNLGIVSYPVVNSVNQLSTGEYVFCTLGGGVDIYNAETGNATHLNTQNGLNNNVVYGCLEDKNGRLWLSTNSGLQIADRRNKRVELKNMKDGLPSDEFAIGAFEKCTDGRFWFGTTDGAISFFPDEYIPSNITAHPFILELRIGNSIITERDEVFLTSDQRDLTIRFSAVDYRHQEQLRYEYRLVGYDTSWRENAPGDRTSKYTNLPYGNYTYELRLKSGTTSFGSTLISLDFHLPAPFWTTWWFRLLMIVTIVLTSGYVVNLYLQVKWRKIKRKIESERRINNERKRISDDLHDNVGSQLAYIVSALDNAQHRLNTLPETDEIKNSISKLSNYTRDTISKLRESIWVLRSESISGSELGARISAMITMLTESHPDKLLHVAYLESDDILPPEVAIESLRITQEAVSNVIKHSDFTEMHVEIRCKSDLLLLQVSDNGIGFDASYRKNGHYGMETMESRARKIGATLEIQSQPGKGTVIKLVWNK